jgi:hypothetical protein
MARVCHTHQCMASRRLEVPRGEKPALEKFLSQTLPNVDLARAKQLLQLGRVRVNGKLAKVGRKLWGGETIEVEDAAPVAARPVTGVEVPVLVDGELAGVGRALHVRDDELVRGIHEGFPRMTGSGL